MGLAALAAAGGILPARSQIAPGVPNVTASGLYISLGGGVGVQQNVTRAANPAMGLAYSRDFSFGPGPAGDLSVGWGFGNGLRLDLAMPILSNPVSLALRNGGSEVKYGGMFSVLYDFNLGLPVTPYVGVGAGGVEIRHDGFGAAGTGFISPVRIAGQVNGDFAYQGIVGLAYPFDFAPGLAMTAEYRVLGLLDPQTGLHGSAPNATGDTASGSSLHFSGDINHSLILGLRYAFTQPRIAVAPAAAAVVETTPSAPAAIRTYLVFFDWDRAELSTRARQIVAQAAAGARRVATTRIDVDGYTDLSGAAEYNRRLSVRRAENVAAELMRDGVPADEIVTVGLGEMAPLVPTAAGAREPANRRVEIVVH